jgi:hypothetical protein
MVLLQLALLVSCLFVPSLVARRGIGSRWTWSAGGFGGFLALYLYSFVWSQGLSEFERMVDSPSLPLGGADGYCFVLAFGFMLAGLFYKPKKETKTALLGKLEGGFADAGRTNGKN